MKAFALSLLVSFLVVSSGHVFAAAGGDDSLGTLIFEDDFERNESDESVEQLGKGWGTNSARRAGGNKQVDLRDGSMYIYMHDTADHAVSVTHPAEFRNGSVTLKFKLDHDDDNLGLNFADLQYKPVHAGHLFVARIGVKSVQLSDLKTGNMDLTIRQQRMAKTLPAETAEMLKGKTKRFANALQTERWHDLRVDVEEDVLTVSIDGKQVGSFQSAGIAHPTKRTLRLAVPKTASVDDVKIYRR